MIRCCIIFLFFLILVVKADDFSKQIAATREMSKVLQDNNYETFYKDYCHPHIKQQLDLESFISWMKNDKGKYIKDLYLKVIEAVDNNADKETLISKYDKDKTEFEFILVKVKNKRYYLRGKEQWHLELKLDNNKWKLKDTD